VTIRTAESATTDPTDELSNSPGDGRRSVDDESTAEEVVIATGTDVEDSSPADVITEVFPKDGNLSLILEVGTCTKGPY
jgi:hypothetical protein